MRLKLLLCQPFSPLRMSQTSYGWKLFSPNEPTWAIELFGQFNNEEVSYEEGMFTIQRGRCLRLFPVVGFSICCSGKRLAAQQACGVRRPGGFRGRGGRLGPIVFSAHLH